MNPDRSRFDNFVEPEPTSGCWLWIGATNAKGYGRFGVEGKNRLAHRASWVLFRGTIPEGMMVLHKCDVRSCVNPQHLFLGVHIDNMRDMVQKGRQPTNRGDRNPRAKLSESDIRLIRDLSLMGCHYRVIAERFGIHMSHALGIVHGKNWINV